MNYQEKEQNLLRAKNWVKENTMTVVMSLALALLFSVMIYAKLGPRSFVSRQAGYKVSCPRGWDRQVGPDRKNVSFSRARYQAFDHALIKVEMIMGNPHGSEAVDYLVNGIVPQLEHTYLGSGDQFQFLRPPVEVMRNGRMWGTMGFYVGGNNEEQVLYATQENGDLYLLTLSSVGSHQEQDKSVFEGVINSFEVKKIARRKYF